MIVKTLLNEELFAFNAENIFQKHIIHKQLVIINSYTEKEEESLYGNPNHPKQHENTNKNTNKNANKNANENANKIFYLIRQ